MSQQQKPAPSARPSASSAAPTPRESLATAAQVRAVHQDVRKLGRLGEMVDAEADPETSLTLALIEMMKQQSQTLRRLEDAVQRQERLLHELAHSRAGR